MSFLDTSFIVDLFREQRRGVRGPARRKLEAMEDEPVRLSVFTVCELETGAALSGSPEEAERVRLFCRHCDVVYPDDRFAPVYGSKLAEIKTQGRSVATMDLLIGTAALIEGDDLVTRNLKDFQKIPGLRVESY